MSILVTGGLGYIGSHIVVELLLQQYSVIVVDNLYHSDINIINDIYIATGKSILFYPYDLLNLEDLNFVFSQNKVEKVIHLAGLKSVAESCCDPLSYFYTNIVATLNLLKVMERYDVCTLIFSSTATVYKPSDDPLSEDSELNPAHPYAKSKRIIEIIIEDYCKLKPHFNGIILRYFNPLGNLPNGKLANTIGENIIPILIDRIKNNVVFEINGHDYNTRDGTAVRDYIHVMDLARAHIFVLNLKGYNVYNLGTNKGTTVLELINAMSLALNTEIKYKYTSRRVGDYESLICNTSKANQLGWHAMMNISDICKDIVKSIY